jgi:hypothetical protein
MLYLWSTAWSIGISDIAVHGRHPLPRDLVQRRCTQDKRILLRTNISAYPNTTSILKQSSGRGDDLVGYLKEHMRHTSWIVLF